MSQNEWLVCLQHLLETLLDSTPLCDLQSTHCSFSISEGEIKDYSDETFAINCGLVVIFGPCHNPDKIVSVNKWGPDICTVVLVLPKCPPSNGHIEVWIENLCSSAKELYTFLLTLIAIYIFSIFPMTPGNRALAILQNFHSSPFVTWGG